MPVGPVDVYVIGFPGNKFDGSIAPAILDLVESGTIRVLDLLFVAKDADGVVAALDVADLGPDLAPAFLGLEIADGAALDDEDAEEVAEMLEPGDSALLVAYENTWALPLVNALVDADAVVLDHIRVPSTVVSAVIAE